MISRARKNAGGLLFLVRSLASHNEEPHSKFSGSLFSSISDGTPWHISHSPSCHRPIRSAHFWAHTLMGCVRGSSTEMDHGTLVRRPHEWVVRRLRQPVELVLHGRRRTVRRSVLYWMMPKAARTPPSARPSRTSRRRVRCSNLRLCLIHHVGHVHAHAHVHVHVHAVS